MDPLELLTLVITNVGPGPAIDLDLELSFEPAPGSDAHWPGDEQGVQNARSG